ncbi:hypothetical protein QYR01_06710 [Brucella anthropi]|uniref:hypothetical protein n=1 Tax=Brucella anthropi TaxID=529 RepID=UPI00267120E5|nr:hypothetical protein [Brucella anthropi]WKT91464.1 hypothetical protein QYR01_06710 [Brucella anthropi]
MTTSSPAKRSSLATESLWGASEIARFMGVSPDYVRKVAKSRSCPIRDIEGRYFCTKTEIVVWLGINNRN